MNQHQKTIKDGWSIRNVRYEDIHAVNPEDFQKLLQSNSISDGYTIVDLMSGYGAVTRELQQYAQKNDLKVASILIDSHKEQLSRSKTELGSEEIQAIQADAREIPLKDNSVDGVIIKMGIHEVPKNDQQTIVDEAYRILQTGRYLSIWDVMPENEEDQILFQDILRKKDELAGFDSLAKERYFYRKDEALEYLKRAGFQNVEHYHKINYRLSTEKRLHTEFGSDEQKLNEWNTYIRSRVPEHLKTKIQYEDLGHTIKMTFQKGIVRGKK